jgi:WD40 repeat protein
MLVASGSVDGTVRVWDYVTGTVNQILRHNNSVRCVRFFSQNRVVSGGHESDVHIWDLSTGNQQVRYIIGGFHTLPSQPSQISGLDVSFDGTLLAAATIEGIVQVWPDISISDTEQQNETLDTYAVESVAFSPSGAQAVSASINTVQVWASMIRAPQFSQMVF